MDYLHEISKGKKETVVNFINDKFTSYRTIMQEHYRSWLLNLAWTRGYQNFDFDTTTKKFRSEEFSKTPWRVRLISNIMLPIVRRITAQMSYVHPIWDTIPATADEEDIQIATISTKVLQNLWQRVDMNRKLIRLLYWQSTCSSAFFKVGWDPDEGDPISVAIKDVEKDLAQQFLERQGIEFPSDTLEMNTGDVCIDVVSPFNITVDETVSTFEESQWVIESQLRSLDWIVEKFGNKWKKLPPSKEAELFLYPKYFNFSERSIQKNAVLVHELYIKKTNKFKEGLHCIIAGSEVIIVPESNPFNHGELPYAHFLEIYDPASLWGTCVAEQIRPNQARYNRISSGIMEQINQMSKNQWLNPRQSGVTEFTNRPGGAINYNYPHKPEQVDLKPIPSYVERLLDRTRLDIQDTASTHDVSEAKAEPGVRSGRAVLALQDADDSVLGPALLWFDEALSRTGRLALQTVIQFSDEERILQVSGEFNELQNVTFSNADLVGKSKQGNYWKVRVKTYGRQSQSRAGREQLVRTLLETGLLNPEVNKEELLNILGAADTISLYDKNTVDRTRQYNEIQMIIQSKKPLPVFPGQNHLLHISVIKRFIASSQWDRVEQETKMLIVDHFTQHTKQHMQEILFPQIYAASLGMVQQPGGKK